MADEPYELNWSGDDVMAALRGASIDGLELAAEHLLQVSSELAPLEEGDLARSGEVSSDRGEQTVAVSYDRPYAVRQHEDMTLRHDAGKQAKYLEDPMNDEQETMLALIASRPRGLLG
ncbi:hypothetical protein AMIS_2460 [Actinoplanes missouriensis 431]|uniref:Uncharacterized protein n=1 Tax=Actinoplanes missouriensis (strain ATCC 14538 / DSM 43046 / CBS 188.64 / JCM 3121 / NBRC 102363 / NCIMB 12654 / NRRL B-3342 / UNCC 431) TaxID=512565 RepID=I0GXH9_ACTM4|nr:hypothetical protein [Actinoplanes missouriensis]KOX45264.1 hypothetical protein ADL19_23365 [Streptomyces purpurogeneiscleroticus]BAL85466.1 hypothetical protein AMIS_2460 [Actinoplanes missouriensis 431]